LHGAFGYSPLVIIIAVVAIAAIVVIAAVAVRRITDASRHGCFRKTARVKNSFMFRTSYDPSEIVISTSSLVK